MEFEKCNARTAAPFLKCEIQCDRKNISLHVPQIFVCQRLKDPAVQVGCEVMVHGHNSPCVAVHDGLNGQLPRLVELRID